MIKQLSNVIFDIVIALRIGIHNFTHARAMDTAKIPFGHLQTFPYCEKKRKFRENVLTARAESIFTVYGKMFSSCVCDSATDLLQFPETVLLYWVRKFIGCAIPSDFAVQHSTYILAYTGHTDRNGTQNKKVYIPNIDK